MQNQLKKTKNIRSVKKEIFEKNEKGEKEKIYRVL